MSFYLKRSEPFPYTILNMSREKSIASMREPRTEILHKDPRGGPRYCRQNWNVGNNLFISRELKRHLFEINWVF